MLEPLMMLLASINPEIIDTSDDRSTGEKIADLTPDEIGRHEAINRRARQLNDRHNQLHLEVEELAIMNKQWWLEQRRKHSLSSESLICRDGALYRPKKS